MGNVELVVTSDRMGKKQSNGNHLQNVLKFKSPWYFMIGHQFLYKYQTGKGALGNQTLSYDKSMSHTL